MLLKDLIIKGIGTVSTLYPEDEAKEMVFILMECLLGTKRYTHIIEPSFNVADKDVGRVESSFMRLASGEPLQYVTGTACFYGRDFRVGPSVLIPRPETEVLCRTALDSLRHSGRQHERILDLCTGSGCIAWTMALERPRAEVVAVDISDDALSMASSQDFREEQSRTGASSPAFIKADVLRDIPDEDPFSEKFDLILSNPPYVMDKEKKLMRTNVLDHEPHLALFVPDDDPLVFYRAVGAWASRLLAEGGTGIVEINEALGSETADVFLDAGFRSAEIIKDFSQRDRFVVFR